MREKGVPEGESIVENAVLTLDFGHEGGQGEEAGEDNERDREDAGWVFVKPCLESGGIGFVDKAVEVVCDGGSCG